MEHFDVCKALIGEDLKQEDLIHVDCYIHNDIECFE